MKQHCNHHAPNDDCIVCCAMLICRFHSFFLALQLTIAKMISCLFLTKMNLNQIEFECYVTITFRYYFLFTVSPMM